MELIVTKFRIGREPFLMLIKSFNLPITIKHSHDFKDYQNNILPVIGLLDDQNKQINQIIQPQEMAKRFSQFSLDQSEPFCNTFLEGSNADILLKENDHFQLFYGLFEQIVQLGCKVQKQVEVGTLRQSLDKIMEFRKQNNKRFLFSDNQISFEDLILNESLNYIYAIDQDWIYDEYQNLYLLKARIDSIQLFQPYYFSNDIFFSNYAPYIPNINIRIQEIIKNNLETFQDLAKCHGILYQYKVCDVSTAEHCPISLFPKKIDPTQIDDIKEKTKILQQLIDRMSKDQEWYSEILESIAVIDEFVRRMLQIQEKVNQCPTACKYNFAIVRNDLMHNASENKWIQVEYNCIAVSFGFISDRVQKFGQTLFDSYYKDLSKELKVKIKHDWNKDIIIDGLESAFLLYNNPKAKVLSIVGDFEGNLYDQRYCELGLAKKGILTKRKVFHKIYESMKLEEDGRLFVDDEEIAVVYFRTGYTPEQYSNENCWLAREMIELSSAVKCPSMNIQLVNFKKLQQIIQNQEQLERYLEEEEATLLKENFFQVWGFENPEKHDEIISMVKQNPNNYVLKPQREGGGNNFYDDEIIKHLESIDIEKRAEYILMERIKPVPTLGFMMKRGKLEETAVISEIGIIGYFISQGDQIIKNEVGGYLLRTKRYLEGEGGVAAGYSVIDSLMVKEDY